MATISVGKIKSALYCCLYKMILSRFTHIDGYDIRWMPPREKKIYPQIRNLVFSPFAYFNSLYCVPETWNLNWSYVFFFCLFRFTNATASILFTFCSLVLSTKSRLKCLSFVPNPKRTDSVFVDFFSLFLSFSVFLFDSMCSMTQIYCLFDGTFIIITNIFPWADWTTTWKKREDEFYESLTDEFYESVDWCIQNVK